MLRRPMMFDTINAAVEIGCFEFWFAHDGGYGTVGQDAVGGVAFLLWSYVTVRQPWPRSQEDCAYRACV